MAKRKILFVEDDKVLGVTLKEFFELSDYTVTVVENAQLGLEEFLKNEYEIVITDIMMPGQMNGVDVVRRIKAYKPNTRIFVCTAYSKNLNSIESVAHHIIKKPFDYAELQNLIEKDFKNNIEKQK